MRVFWSKTRILRGFVSLCTNVGDSDSTRLQDELEPLLCEYFYKPQIFLYGTQPMVLFVGLAESFCLWIFCLLLLLVIVVVDMLLAAPSTHCSYLILVGGIRISAKVIIEESKEYIIPS